MRSELGKECRKLFRKMMVTEFPEYREDKSQAVPQGWYVWTYRHSEALFLFIVLVIDSKGDQFTIEGGWSHDGKVLCSLSDVRNILSAPSYVRVAKLWSDHDYWWRLILRPERLEDPILYWNDPIEQCLPVVAPAVSDAAQKLKEYLIPVFEKIVQFEPSTPTNSAHGANKNQTLE